MTLSLPNASGGLALPTRDACIHLTCSTNTREVRYRTKLEDERLRLVDKAMKHDPSFRPPVAYRERAFIPSRNSPRSIFSATSTPEERKLNQLRELAALCGPLRIDETCKNCGGTGHRKYDCPERKTSTVNIVCRVCGTAGHPSRDCSQGKDSNATGLSAREMPGGAVTNITTARSSIPPWRRPEAWRALADQQQQNNGYHPS
ncbi:hypothetical protein K438DRAFT_1832584 [Mycena galopus ATCC 62051]|nr:hypothetical protein K438DRAFT_1832584 [Mycena galopus ATCC 62051]